MLLHQVEAHVQPMDHCRRPTAHDMTDQQSSRSAAQHCAEERVLVDPDLFDSCRCTDISIFSYSNIADSHNFLRLTQWQQRSGTIRVVVRVRPMFAPGTVQSSFLWLQSIIRM